MDDKQDADRDSAESSGRCLHKYCCRDLSGTWIRRRLRRHTVRHLPPQILLRNPAVQMMKPPALKKDILASLRNCKGHHRTYKGSLLLPFAIVRELFYWAV